MVEETFNMHRALQEVINIAGDQPNAQEEVISITDGVAPEQTMAEASGDIFQNLVGMFSGNSNENRQEITQAQDVTVTAVGAALAVNLLIFLVLMLGYEFFSRALPSVYRGRSIHKPNQDDRSTISSSQSDRHISLPPSKLPFGWVVPIMKVSWSQLLKTSGLDAYMFIRYIRMCLQITAISGLYGAIILMPVYASGANDADGWYHLSMANIQQGNWKLWFPTIFMWLQTLYVIFLMNEEYKHYYECRMEFLAKGDVDVHPQQKYSLMVEQIPHELRSDRAMYDYFDALFPGKVHSARVVLNIPDLEELSVKRQRVRRRLEKAIAILEATGRRPVHIVGRPRLRCCGIERLTFIPAGRKEIDLWDDDGRLPQRGEKADSITYYTRYLAIMNEKVAKMQGEKIEYAQSGDNSLRASQWIAHTVELATDAATTTLTGRQQEGDGLVLGFKPRGKSAFSTCFDRLGFDFLRGSVSSLLGQVDMVVDSVTGKSMSSTAFVTFKDLQSVTCAVRAPLSSESGMLSVQMAPEPRDIRWENAFVNHAWSVGREWAANILLVLGAFLWSIPVASLQALSNMESLSTIPGLGWLNNYSGGDFAKFVNGYLPVVALLSLVMVLPIVFQHIAEKYELRKTNSDVQRSVLSRFFYYQLANIYVTVTAGSAMDALADILNHPSNAFAILGKSLPRVVGYFIIFLVTKILVGLPMVLLRIVPLIRMLFLKCFCREKLLTQQELDEVYKENTIVYGWEYPNLLLVITICFTYSTISPIILPFGAIFFLGAFVVYKKQALFVYSPTYESGGLNFPSACHRTLIGLICGQITLIGYSILRVGFYQPAAMLPLPFYTLGMINFFKVMYEEPSSYLSLERAIDLDGHPAARSVGHDMYRQPVLTEPDARPFKYRRSGDDDSVMTESMSVLNEKVV